MTTKSLTAISAVIAVSALWLAGCAPSEPAAPTAPTVTKISAETETVKSVETVTPSATAARTDPTGASGANSAANSVAGETRASTSKSPEAPDLTVKPNPWRQPRDAAPKAHSGAGGPVPANAIPVHTVKRFGETYAAIFVTPSGNIGCEMIESENPQHRVFGCGVKNYRDNSPLGTDPNGIPYWYMDVLRGEPVAKTDAGMYEPGVYSDSGYVEPQVVGYGDVVSHGNMVCGVYEVGVTCWDANSGRGVYMERSQTVFF